jgi:hypothetical protein
MTEHLIRIITPGRTLTIDFEGSLRAEELKDAIIEAVLKAGGINTSIGVTLMLHPPEFPELVEHLIDAAQRGKREAVLRLMEKLHESAPVGHV